MTGKYAPTSMAGISNQRTQQAIEVITKFGGEVKSMYATLRDNDLLFVLDLPGTNVEKLVGGDSSNASYGVTATTGR